LKFLLSNTEIPSDKFKDMPFDLSVKKIGSYSVLAENQNWILEENSIAGITDGYLKDLNLDSSESKDHTLNAFRNICEHWPLSENITGSFSSLVIDKNTDELVLCNDLIGIYPLYYLKNEDSFYVSNSIILLGILSGCEFDEAGIVQRCLGPEFSNFGSRTILKNCKRMLPGEWIKFNNKGIKLLTKYDNSLYQNISKPDQKNDLHKDYWNALKNEIKHCVNNSPEVNIALSGGMDSRIVLGAIPDNKRISSFTFGGRENYETKIAARLAKIKKANFQNYSQPELYFPPVDVLKKYTLETESLYLCSWLEILENVSKKENEPLLIGDLTTAITGRTIKKFSTREFKQKNFFKYFLLNRDYEFEKSDKQSLAIWKKSISEKFKRRYSKAGLAQLKIKLNREELLDCLDSDLNELFNRIDAHNIPFIELVDELFTWYTHTRIPMGKQVLLTNSKFRSYCPSMSLQMLRLSSNLHPNTRLNLRFIKKLFKEEKELKKLNSVPTSQVPLIPQYFPDVLRFPIWALRNKIDQFLIDRMMKRKDITRRYRLFKSINWALVYQNPDMEKNLKAYFKNNHLGTGFFDRIFKLAVQRKKLEQWPFANMEIINASGLNVEIDLIKASRKRNAV